MRTHKLLAGAAGPPLKKCVYDFSDRNEMFASVGRVVRFYLTKDIVDRIKVKLADYRTMYQSEDENENDGEVKSTETDDTAAKEIKLELPETEGVLPSEVVLQPAVKVWKVQNNSHSRKYM